MTKKMKLKTIVHGDSLAQIKMHSEQYSHCIILFQYENTIPELLNALKKVNDEVKGNK